MKHESEDVYRVDVVAIGGESTATVGV